MVAIAVVAVAGLMAWRIYAVHHKDAKPSSSNSPLKSAAAAASQTSQPLTTGTDNQSLLKDLDNLDRSLSEGTQTLQSAVDATNDQDKVIDVPTDSGTGEQHLSLIKERANAEISRRISLLHQLDSTISGAGRLTPSSKSMLSREVDGEIGSLSALREQIKSDGDVDSARIDAQAIFTDYRVYAFVLPKVWLTRVSDDQQAVEAKLNTLSGKLQTRVNETRGSGKDVTAMQVALNDMIAKTTAAQKLSSVAEEAILPLQPTDYNNDHAILNDHRDQLKTAHSNNKTAFADAKSIVQGL
jgi:hypothetical protein